MSPTSEAARNDLYNGLSEVLGPERAETLMSQLPRFDPNTVATKADIAANREVIEALRTDIASLKTNLIAGLIAIVTAMIGIFFAAL